MYKCKCGMTKVKFLDPNINRVCNRCGSKLEKVESTKQESLNSFIEVKLDVEALNEKYVDIINVYNKFGDLTDSELADKLGFKDPNKVRPRRYELVHEYGEVKNINKRVCNITKKMCNTWGLI